MEKLENRVSNLEKEIHEVKTETKQAREKVDNIDKSQAITSRMLERNTDILDKLANSLNELTNTMHKMDLSMNSMHDELKVLADNQKQADEQIRHDRDEASVKIQESKEANTRAICENRDAILLIDKKIDNFASIEHRLKNQEEKFDEFKKQNNDKLEELEKKNEELENKGKIDWMIILRDNISRILGWIIIGGTGIYIFIEFIK